MKTGLLQKKKMDEFTRILLSKYARSKLIPWWQHYDIIQFGYILQTPYVVVGCNIL